ncbi:hypothetical protein PF008_g10283 [Phytophthora fragariae]|uniref:Uncharacterized protein n=1 Tax=Phytophthora fragariae TaxID=53985 RepID=A0A6G0RU92_9STRA|nr:hypothetical protein PF008_g10283 [Phytophthora fragariae]
MSPGTRSGRAIVPAVVHEAGTIPVTLLVYFRLPPLMLCSGSRGSLSAASSQRTVTDPSPLASPASTMATSKLVGSPSRQSSQTSPIAPWSPQSPFVESQSRQEDGESASVTISQTSTIAPWSPQSPFNRLRRHRTVVVTLWFAEVIESDGYDSEVLTIIGPPAPPRRASITPSGSSSPGFVVVGPQPSDILAEWRLESWPREVEQLVAYGHLPR